MTFTQDPFVPAPSAQAAPVVDPAILAAILAALGAQSAAPAVEQSAAPQFEVDDAVQALLAEHNSSVPRRSGAGSGLQSFDIVAGQQLIFNTTAELTIDGNNLIGNEALLWTPSIKLVRVAFSRQEHTAILATGEANPKAGSKYNVLRMRFALPGARMGYKSAVDGSLKEFNVFAGNAKAEAEGANYSLMATTQTSGVMDETMQLLQNNLMANGWIERAYTPEGEVAQSSSERVWTLEPNTGDTNDRAHMALILSRNMGLDVKRITLRAGRIGDQARDLFTDPLSGLLDGLHKDIADREIIAKNNAPAESAIVKSQGRDAQSITGSAYRSLNGEPSPMAGRVTKSADLTGIEFVTGGELRLWENGGNTNTLPTAPTTPAVSWKVNK